MLPTFLGGRKASTNKGATSKGKSATNSKGKASAVAGRTGASASPASDAISDIFQFTQSYTLGTAAVVDTKILNVAQDIIGLAITVGVVLTGNTNTTADQLTSLQQWQVLGPKGPLMNILPAPDFYQLEQRFSPLHVKPTVVALNGTTATSGTYLVYGINLPALGPTEHYTLLPAMNPYSSIGTATTGGTVTLTVAAIIGDASGVTSRYVYSGLPFTPSGGGVNDLVPVSPVQNADLVELFISGMTSDLTDISFIQSDLTGIRILPSTLVARANAEMISALDSDKLFPLFALKTNLNLAQGAHFFVNWGSSPSSSIRLGFFWLE